MWNRGFGVRLAGLAFLCFAFFGAAASSAVAASTTHSTATLQAKCAGDTIFGELRTDASSGVSYTLALFQQRVKQGPWLPTNKSVVIVTRPGQSSYPFTFDVASYSAWAYAISGAGKDEIVRGESCAPGHQVPEAPNVLLLAFAVAGVFGVSLVRQRRRGIR